MNRPSWDAVLGSVGRLIRDQHYDQAIAELSSFLQGSESRDDSRAALEMRSTVYELAGDRDRSRRDLEAAYQMTPPGEYSTYVTEVALGNMARAQGTLDAARAWYRAAMKTALAGQGISAGAALQRFLDVTSHRNLEEDESALLWAACRSSWHVLGLRQEVPDDLTEAIRAILQAQGGLPPAQ